jgi:membrane protein DedA with SNARE-associated domain
MQSRYRKKRSFLEKLAAFSLPDVIGGFLSILLTACLVYTLFRVLNDSSTVSKDVLNILGPIVSVIVGYYFGRRGNGEDS